MIHPKLNLKQGVKCSLSPEAKIGFNETGKGEMILGNKVVIREGCIIRTCTGRIQIKANTVINYGCVMHGMGGIYIGENCLLSPNVQLYAQNHGIKKGTLIRNQKQTGNGIIIGVGVWIGAGAIITDGITIGKGAVIGAGSVLTKHVRPNEIWAGNPAKKIGVRK